MVARKDGCRLPHPYRSRFWSDRVGILTFHLDRKSKTPPSRKERGKDGATSLSFANDQQPTTVFPYFVLPPSTFSLSVAAACAAASRAVSTRNGEQET